MAIETLEDILEEIANKCEVYGNPKRNDFVCNLDYRIREALIIEQKLNT